MGALSMQQYVKETFPDRFDGWLASLPEASRDIHGGRILPSSWYPVSDALAVPLEAVVEQLHGGDERGAWEVGRFGAELALTGFYRLLLKIGSAGMLVSRSAKYMSLYYRPSEVRVVHNGSECATLRIVAFAEPHDLVETSVCGWIERGLEISGCRQVQLERTASLVWGDDSTEIEIHWA